MIFTIPATWLAIRPEYAHEKSQVDRVAGLRTGIVMSQWMAEHNGWKVGDHISVKGAIPRKDGADDGTFDIVGLMRNTEGGPEQRQVLANWAYLDEARSSGSGIVSHQEGCGRQPDRFRRIHCVDPAAGKPERK
ncbi:MAG: hypothetical protein WDO68_29605 [Gammaproteobacteria bacterium]